MIFLDDLPEDDAIQLLIDRLNESVTTRKIKFNKGVWKMKYTVTCFNGGPIFGIQIPFVRLDEVRVEVDADSESGAISIARSKVTRDYYEVIDIKEWHYYEWWLQTRM